jgi:hypothetical protein
MRRIQRVERVALAGLLVALAGVACGSSDDDDDLESGASLCQSDCSRRVGANCSTTPSNYADDCVRACNGARERINPECADELDALFQCIGKNVQYGCTNGVLSPTPQGACAAEAAACATCSTTDVTACFGI